MDEYEMRMMIEYVGTMMIEYHGGNERRAMLGSSLSATSVM